ncbi:MAG TPA: Nramp family divalent metal transporter [bacterium]|nr:Nramp family divalent metal transporter [bacterium]
MHQSAKLSLSVSKLLAILGPGFYLIGYNIGTGSVTTMASAGSRWGMSLTWTVILSCFFTYVGLYAFSRYTLITGDTVLYAVRQRFPFGKLLGFFIMSAVIIAEFFSLTGLSAIVVDLLHEWIAYATGFRHSLIKLALTVTLAAVLFALLWTGEYQLLEKILTALVMIMGMAFLITAVLVVPSWKDILAGLLPRVPPEPDASLIVAGMAGTTFSSSILYCRSITIKEKGWRLADRKKADFDTAVSVLMMFLLSIAIMICAAGTLYVMNRPVENAIDMVRTLEPLAGKFAISLFILGIVGAGVSSLIPTILIAPWVLSDYTNRKINPATGNSRFFVLLGVLVCLTGPYIRTNPVALMVLTMALLAVILPLSTIAITLLLNQKRLGEKKNTLLLNAACLGAILFSLVMSYYGLIGISSYFD